MTNEKHIEILQSVLPDQIDSYYLNSNVTVSQALRAMQKVQEECDDIINDQSNIIRSLESDVKEMREEVERLKDANKKMVKELASAYLKIKELNKDDY